MTQPTSQGQFPVLRREHSKSQLQTLPPSEQALFLSFAHIMNEINALLRAAVWSNDLSSPIQAKGDGQVTLTLMFLKLLAGKLNEAYKVIQGAYFGSGVSKSYDALLRADGREALATIKRYFSHPKNNVSEIRNNYAFHYSPYEMSQVLPSISEELVSYMQRDAPQNNLFYFAEVVAAEALFQSMGMPNNNASLDKLVDELISLAAAFAKFFDDVMGTFLENLGQEAWQDQAQAVEFDQLPKFDDVHIPWFTDG